MPRALLDPDHGEGADAMVFSSVNSWGKTMSGSEQMFLVLTIGAFALFGVVLAFVDVTTASVRDRHRG